MTKATCYKGGNESTDTKYITVNGRKFKITADTTVLRVDSDADDDDEIGQAYTYGTTSMTKAQKKSTNPDVYTANVWFILDEAAAANEDDKEIDVLVIDSTGAFKGYKVADTNNGTTVTDGTYTSGNASVKVADSAIVTDAAATYSSANNAMIVQLTVDSAYKNVTSGKITVTVNAVDNTTVTIPATVTNGKIQISVPCDKGDKVVVNVADGAFTK